MSKRTIILLILLILISVVLVVTTSTKKKPTMVTAVSVTKPVAIGHTMLSLRPTSTHAVAIDVNTNGDNVTAVQAEILYDPTQINHVQVSQGTFFTDPLVLSNRVVQSDGRISYAVELLPLQKPKKGSGTVAIISYAVVDGAKGPITFTFLPKTQVTALGITTSVLKTANNATITPEP